MSTSTPPTEPNQPSAPQLKVDLSAGRDLTIGEIVGGDKIVHNVTNVYQVAAPVFGAGMKALGELMKNSEAVRGAVVAFRVDFEAATSQVDVLADYKDLHDLLHQLQFQCYNGIVQAASRFPDDEQSVDNLLDYQLTLEGILTQLRAVVARAPETQPESAWIEDIAEAQADLKAALDGSDTARLKKVTWRLNRLFSTQPTRITTRLNAAARALRLPSLLEALGHARDYLLNIVAEKDKLDQFQTGVDALAQLSEQLQALVTDHERWQTIDVELRRIEALIERDLIELQMSWPDVKAQAASLYGGRAEDWATALVTDVVALDEALAADNPVKVKRAFRSYRRRASDRFYRVDFELKALAGGLRQIGEPLTAILKMIE
jgi:CHASE3 domain sensor protein